MSKYRLEPDEKGTYTLQRISEGLTFDWDTKPVYMTVAVRLTPEEADETIKNLERKTLYYRESS